MSCAIDGWLKDAILTCWQAVRFLHEAAHPRSLRLVATLFTLDTLALRSGGVLRIQHLEKLLRQGLRKHEWSKWSDVADVVLKTTSSVSQCLGSGVAVWPTVHFEKSARVSTKKRALLLRRRCQRPTLPLLLAVSPARAASPRRKG